VIALNGVVSDAEVTALASTLEGFPKCD